MAANKVCSLGELKWSDGNTKREFYTKDMRVRTVDFDPHLLESHKEWITLWPVWIGGMIKVTLIQMYIWTHEAML